MWPFHDSTRNRPVCFLPETLWNCPPQRFSCRKTGQTRGLAIFVASEGSVHVSHGSKVWPFKAVVTQDLGQAWNRLTAQGLALAPWCQNQLVSGTLLSHKYPIALLKPLGLQPGPRFCPQPHTAEVLGPGLLPDGGRGLGRSLLQLVLLSQPVEAAELEGPCLFTCSSCPRFDSCSLTSQQNGAPVYTHAHPRPSRKGVLMYHFWKAHSGIIVTKKLRQVGQRWNTAVSQNCRLFHKCALAQCDGSFWRFLPLHNYEHRRQGWGDCLTLEAVIWNSTFCF